MAASACHGSREAIIFCNRLLCLFIYLLFIFNISVMDLGNRWDSSAELSRQVVWGLE